MSSKMFAYVLTWNFNLFDEIISIKCLSKCLHILDMEFVEKDISISASVDCDLRKINPEYASLIVMLSFVYLQV